MSEHLAQAAFARLRAAVVKVADPGPNIEAAVGTEFPGVEGAALTKAEAAFSKDFADMIEQEREFTPTAEKDKVTARAVRSFAARKQVRRDVLDAIESDTAREAAVEKSDAEEAEAAARAVELLDQLEDALDAAGLASYVRGAARDRNPKRRQSPMPTGSVRRPGGQLLAQLRTAVEGIGQADFYVLPYDEYAKYWNGEPALDVFGKSVPAGLPPKRVRRSYAPTTLRPVGVREVEGGV